MFAVSDEHLPLRWNLCASYLYSKLSTFICRLGSVFIAVIKDCGGKWRDFNTGHLFFSSLDCLEKNHPDVAALCEKFVKFTFLPAVVIFSFVCIWEKKSKIWKPLSLSHEHLKLHEPLNCQSHHMVLLSRIILTNCCDAAADLRLRDVDWFRELLTSQMIGWL